MTEWISTKKRLPDDCLTVIAQDDEGEVFASYHMGRKWYIANTTLAINRNILYWQDMPEPMKAEAR